MADVGELKVKITADSAQMEKAMKRVNDTLKDVAKKVAIASAAAASALAVIVAKQLQVIDASAKMADKLGITMEAMGGLEFIASLTGTSVEALGKTLQKTTQALIVATDASTLQGQALNALGLSVSQLQQMSPDQAFYQIADAIGEVDNSTRQAQIAFQLWGGEGAELLGVIRSTSGQFNELAQEAINLGYAISRESAAKVEQFNDTITRLGYVMQGMARSLTVGVTPGLTELGNAMLTASRNGGILRTAVDNIAGAINAFLKEIARALRTLDAMNSSQQENAENAEQAADLYRERAEATRELIDAQGGLNRVTQDANNITSDTSRASQELLNRYNGMLQLSQQAAQQAVQNYEEVARIAEGSVQMPNIPTPGAAGGAGPSGAQGPDRSAMMEQLVSSLQTEEQAEADSYERRQAMIRELQESGYMSQQEAYNMELDLLSDHEDKLNEIRERGMTEAEQFSKLSWHRQTATALGELGALMQGVEGNSRKMFRIQKAGALAMAIVNTYEGVSSSLSKYPMPLAAVMAAAHLAAGLNQVNAIRKTQYGGGGGGGGAAIPTPSTGDTETGGMSGQGQTGKRDVRIVIDAEDNSLFSGRQVRDLMGRIGNELSNGENFGSFQVVRA